MCAYSVIFFNIMYSAKNPYSLLLLCVLLPLSHTMHTLCSTINIIAHTGLVSIRYNKSELITITRVVITSEVKGVESSINEMRTNER